MFIDCTTTQNVELVRTLHIVWHSAQTVEQTVHVYIHVHYELKTSTIGSGTRRCCHARHLHSHFSSYKDLLLYIPLGENCIINSGPMVRGALVWLAAQPSAICFVDFACYCVSHTQPVHKARLEFNAN